MGNLLDGLFLYEIILMILGTILFVAIVILILKKKEINRNHLLGFGIAIISIAFSGIKSFSISDGIIKIEKSIETLEGDPDNEEMQKKLHENVVAVEERPIQDPERLVTLSEANLELGNKSKATEQAESALQKSPDLPEAVEVLEVIEVQKKIENVRSHPDDMAAKEALKEDITKLKKLSTKSGRRTAHIAEGYATLGDAKNARVYIDSTKVIQPTYKGIEKVERILPLDPGTRE